MNGSSLLFLVHNFGVNNRAFVFLFFRLRLATFRLWLRLRLAGLEPRRRNPLWLILLFVVVGFSIAVGVQMLAGSAPYGVLAAAAVILVSIPMLGKVPSLNVSVAGGIVLYEIMRQRRLAPSSAASKRK